MPNLWELPPEAEWWTFGLMLAVLMLFLGLCEVVRNQFGWSPEFSRKSVHIGVGVLSAFTPALFTVPLPPILLAILFIAINTYALKKRLLPGIHGVDRLSYGSITYPVAFLFLVIFFWFNEPLIISLSMLVLALGDAAAAIVGESMKNPTVYRLTSDRKSIEGSLGMAVVSFAVLLTGLILSVDTEHIPFVYIVTCAGIVSVTATACEAISSRGLDNLTLTLSTAFVLSFFLIPQSSADVYQLTMAVSFGIFIAVASHKVKLLTLSGSVATFLLAVIVFGICGWQWTIPLVTFFVLSSFISKAGAARKAELERTANKIEGRDHAQVFANGGIGGMLALVTYWYPEIDLYPLFVGSIAAVTADTWGTEIGMLARGHTVRLPDLKTVSPGSNGGMTIAGSLAGAGGSVVIGISASEWLDAGMLGWIILAGIAGSLVDSILGATVQAEFRCPVCATKTGQRTHCNNQPTVHVRGFAWLNNDGVNWVCAFTGALVMGMVFVLPD